MLRLDQTSHSVRSDICYSSSVSEMMFTCEVAQEVWRAREFVCNLSVQN